VRGSPIHVIFRWPLDVADGYELRKLVQVDLVANEIPKRSSIPALSRISPAGTISLLERLRVGETVGVSSVALGDTQSIGRSRFRHANFIRRHVVNSARARASTCTVGSIGGISRCRDGGMEFQRRSVACESPGSD